MPDAMNKLRPANARTLFRGLPVALIEGNPHPTFAVPRTAAGCALGIFGGALLEEVGMLDAVEDFYQLRQRRAA